MSNKGIEPKAHDLEEEQKAEAYIKAQLAGKPIVKTSGNEEHRLNPVDVNVNVDMTKEGQEFNITITHTDRHHPELVYETIKAELAQLPELTSLTPKQLDTEKDFCKKDGKVVIRYAAAGDSADNLIHALSDAQEKKSMGESSAPAQMAEAANDQSFHGSVATAIDKTIQHFNQGRS